MNLWVKGKGLLALLMLAVFCSSCDEEENTIGLPVDNQLELKYFEYVVPAEMVWTDSVISQNLGIIYSGQIDLDEAGVVKAVPYISFTPQRYDSNINLPENAVLKEFYLELDYINEINNSTEPSTQSLQIYQLADTISDYKNFNISDYQELGALLGEKTFTYYPDTLRIDIAADTVNYREQIVLDNQKGEEIFAKLKAEESETLYNRAVFENYFKGLAVVPDVNNSLIMGFSSTQSRVVFKYEFEKDEKTNTGYFYFYPANKYYHNITPNTTAPDLQGTAFADIPCCYEGYHPSDEAVYQLFGTGINVKLDLSAFKMFADSLPHVIINAAVLELDDVQSTAEGVDPPEQVSFYLTNSEGRRTTTEITNINHFRTLPTERAGVSPIRLGDPAALHYNEIQDYYKTNITLFINYLINEPETPAFLLMESTDVTSLVQMPSLKRSAKSIGAVRIPKESIKVKIYYSTVD